MRVSPYFAAVPIAILLVTIAVVALRARRKTRVRKPVREPSAFVLLDDNVWSDCAVDGIREPWAKLTTEPVRGFCGVPAGRHRVRTKTRAGDAILDFVIYPGEVLAWRLDADRARWQPCDVDSETRSLLEATPASGTDVNASGRLRLPGWLVHLRTTMNLVASRPSAPPSKASDDRVDRIRKKLGKLALRADVELEDEDENLLPRARDLGESLIGLGLTRKELRALVAPVREVASRRLAQGDAERAMRIVALGLAALPGDPELMVLAGCTLAARGETDEALGALAAALERDRCLDATDVAKAMRARMELRGRHGLRARV